MIALVELLIGLVLGYMVFAFCRQTFGLVSWDFLLRWWMLNPIKVVWQIFFGIQHMS